MARSAARSRRGFGRIEQRASGRFRASYLGPDTALYRAPNTFAKKGQAEGWLAGVKRDIDLGSWTPPNATPSPALKVPTFAEYAATFMAQRSLKPKSREAYCAVLANQLLPTFGEVKVPAITAYAVKAWHTDLSANGTPTLLSHAYGLLRTILGEAVHDGLIPANPCHIRGAGNVKRVHKVKPATVAELATIAEAMPERLGLMVLLAGWCGLRFGELTELRRDDIDLTRKVIRVRRGVVRAGGEFIVGTPKSDAGIRDVAIPPHLLPAIRDHLSASISGGRNGLLFPANDGVSHLAPSTLYGKTTTATRKGWGFYEAREVAGRPDLRFHDLRHTGAVLAASTGATLAELMARLGHSTAGAALRYQHAAQDRDQVIAEALSALVTTPATR